MDVTDTGSRSEDERAAEAAWFGRMTEREPGLDPATNFREHHDPVVTAAPGPIAHDGTFLGGEKERILTGRWVDEGAPDLPSTEVLAGEGPALGPPPSLLPDVGDTATPLGTPEGAWPEAGETWGGAMTVDGVPY